LFYVLVKQNRGRHTALPQRIKGDALKRKIKKTDKKTLSWGEVQRQRLVGVMGNS